MQLYVEFTDILHRKIVRATFTLSLRLRKMSASVLAIILFLNSWFGNYRELSLALFKNVNVSTTPDVRHVTCLYNEIHRLFIAFGID